MDLKMLSFKQYLKEDSAHDLFLNGWAPEQYKINPDGTGDWVGGINISGEFLRDLGVDKFPVKFGETKNFTYVETSPILTILENSPKKVIGQYNIVSENPKLSDLTGSPDEVTENYIVRGKYTSVKGMTPIIGNNASLMSRELKSLTGIGTYCKSIGGNLKIYPKRIKSNILGILKIKDVQLVEFMSDNISSFQKEDSYKPFHIINSHLDKGRNLRKCKSELEEAGFSEYAKL